MKCIKESAGGNCFSDSAQNICLWSRLMYLGRAESSGDNGLKCDQNEVLERVCACQLM